MISFPKPKEKAHISSASCSSSAVESAQVFTGAGSKTSYKCCIVFAKIEITPHVSYLHDICSIVQQTLSQSVSICLMSQICASCFSLHVSSERKSSYRYSISNKTERDTFPLQIIVKHRVLPPVSRVCHTHHTYHTS